MFGKCPLMFCWKTPTWASGYIKIQLSSICTSQSCIFWNWGYFQETALILRPYSQMHCPTQVKPAHLESALSLPKHLNLNSLKTCFIPPKALEKVYKEKKSDLIFIFKESSEQRCYKESHLYLTVRCTLTELISSLIKYRKDFKLKTETITFVQV